MIVSNGRGIEYTSADLPRTITDATHRTTLKYDAFGARVMKRVAPVLTPDAPISTTLTLAGLYERRTEGEHVDHRFYVHGDGGPVAEVVFHEDKTPEETHYLIRDAHGSISAVLAPDGSVVERLFYEPFGARVSSDGAPVASAVSGVPLGFTGHREDDDLGLIHMNGRVYDPTLRRFWTPDPLVGNSLAGQTWNPYSYVWNNPLRYIDPSGYLGTDLDADTSLLDRIGSWLSDFLRPDKEMVRRNRPEKQLLPGGSSGGQTDTQSESTASSANGISIAPDSLQTVERSRPGVPAKEPGTSLLTILAHLIPAYATVDAGLSTAGANFEDIKKASDAMGQNNPSLAADHLLKVPERAARALGEPILGGIRGAVDLPGDAMDAVNAETTGERVRAAVETGKDLLGAGALAAVVLAGSGSNASSGSGGSVRGFHGTIGDNVLGILDTGGFLPKNGKVFLSEVAGDTFVHGADLSRAAAFSIEVEVGGAAPLSRVSVPGNPKTILIQSTAMVPARIVRLLVRTPTGNGGFAVRSIEGEAAIRAFLRQ